MSLDNRVEKKKEQDLYFNFELNKETHFSYYGFEVYNGSCMDLIPTICRNNEIRCIIADIPYNEVNRESAGLRNLDKGLADKETFNPIDLATYLTNYMVARFYTTYIFCGARQISSLYDWYDARQPSRQMVWIKLNPSPMNAQHMRVSAIENMLFTKTHGTKYHGGFKKNVVQASIVPAIKYRKRHPTEKPVELLCELIEDSSEPGDTIFDPCMGSGSTGEAALLTGRKFIGIELDEEWYKIAKNRLINASNNFGHKDKTK